MLTGKKFGRQQARPIYVYERRLRLSSLAPSKTPPTANAAGRPRPISGAGAEQRAAAQGLGIAEVVAAFCAKAGTVPRHNQIINVSPFIPQLLLAILVNVTSVPYINLKVLQPRYFVKQLL
jgi:hypothetical protein